jgi:hypothetical protein
MGRIIRRVLGVDPGLASAAAAVFGFHKHNYPEILGVLDVPTFGEGTTKRIDVVMFRRWLMELDPDFAYVEAASTMPAIPDAKGFRRAMGAGSAGRYMRAAGALEACVELCGIEWCSVQPAVWKRALGLVGPNKGNSLDLIRSTYPNVADKWFKRKLDHNRAEASLIAIWGAARCDLITLQ